MAIPPWVFNPETKAAFTIAPEVVYSPIVPLAWFVTNRFDPDTAIPPGSFGCILGEVDRCSRQADSTF